MKKSIVSISMVAALSVLPVESAHAIIYGEPDGTAHPYVGLMVAQDDEGNPLWRCSGTLLSSTVFLTAGHCTEAPAAHVEIWFDADVESGIPANGYPDDGDVGGTPYTHPQYDPDAFYLYDLGVVVLDEPYVLDEYGALPELDQLDALATQRGLNKVSFTAVGYGLQEVKGPMDQAELIRQYAELRLVQLKAGSQRMVLSGNANTGAICFGDSGGPNFIDDTNVIAGVSSFVLNQNCAGLGGVYRVDQYDDLTWLCEQFGICS